MAETPRPKEDIQDLSADDYRNKLLGGELPGQDDQQETPKGQEKPQIQKAEDFKSESIVVGAGFETERSSKENTVSKIGEENKQKSPNEIRKEIRALDRQISEAAPQAEIEKDLPGGVGSIAEQMKRNEILRAQREEELKRSRPITEENKIEESGSKVEIDLSPIQIDTDNVEKIRPAFEAETEQIKQQTEAAEKRQKQEKAWEVLRDTEENWTKKKMSEMAEVVRDATDRDLVGETDSMVKKNLEERKIRIVKISEVRPQMINNELLKISNERYSESLLSSLNNISAEDRKKYEENGQINMAKFQQDVDAKMANLGISREQFGQLVKDDIDVLSIKKRGFFKRLISFGMMDEYVIPFRVGLPPAGLSDKQFKNLLESKGVKANEAIKTEAEKMVDKKIVEGQRRLLREKQVCAKSIIREIIKVGEQKPEELKIEVPTPEKVSSVVDESKEKKPRKKVTKTAQSPSAKRSKSRKKK